MTEICTRAIFYNERSDENDIRKYNKSHYVSVLLKIRSKLFLFIAAFIPLLSDKGSTSFRILTTILLQSAALSAVLIPALVSHHHLRWTSGGKVFTLFQGVFARKTISLTFDQIASLSVTRTPFTSVFKAVKLEMRVCASDRKPAVALYLSDKDADKIFASVMHPSHPSCTLIPSAPSFILMCLCRANFLVGLFSLSLFIFSFGNTFDSLLTQNFYYDISKTAEYLLPYFPPLISALFLLVLLGWFIHFLSICFKDARQRVSASKNHITIVRGLISVRITCIRKNSIASLTRRQTLLSGCFKQSDVFVSSDAHSELCLLTAWNSSSAFNVCGKVIFPFVKPDTVVKVPDNARLIWWLPYASGGIFLCLLLIKLYASGAPLTEAVLIILLPLIICIWKTLIGIIASAKGRIELSGQYILIHSARRFSVVEKQIYLGYISGFRISQTIFQKYRNLCTVRIRAQGNKKALKCMNLPYDTICRLCERLK